MNEEADILSKMDALLKRHQPAPSAAGEVPTLTEVVTPPEIEPAPIPVLTEIVDTSPAPPQPAAAQAVEPPPLPPDSIPPEMLEPALTILVNDWLDRNMPAKLDKLDAYTEELVRETVTQELQKHMDSLAADLAKMVREEMRKASASTPPERGDRP